jgi:hypothetical protein
MLLPAKLLFDFSGGKGTSRQTPRNVEDGIFAIFVLFSVIDKAGVPRV